jgi:phenylacetate-CoA ligase
LLQNAQGEWQVNSETLFVEILDENNKAVLNGLLRIVITLFTTNIHLYDTTHIYWILDEKAHYKKTDSKKIIGRTNDVAILPSGKNRLIDFYYVTKKHHRR